MNTKTTKHRARKWWIALAIFFGLILILLLAGYMVFHHYFSMMQQGEESMEILDSIPEEPEDFPPEASLPEESGEDSEESKENGEESKENGEESNGSSGSGLQQREGMKNWTSYAGKVYQDPDTYNILLVGMDSREGDMRSRSDTMIVASINKKTQKIVLTSIMRDTYVDIPEVGGNRINAATAYGGINLLVRTIESNFNIHIDNYMVTDFFTFADAVDLMGGIDLQISAAEAESMNNYIKEYNRLTGETEGFMEIKDGLVHVNGKQALSYCRVRNVGYSDFQRTERQRTVLLKLADKAKGMGIGDINRIAEAILPQLVTNLSQTDCLSLLWDALTQYKNYKIETFRIPADGTYQNVYIRKMAVLKIDFKKNIEMFFEKAYNR